MKRLCSIAILTLSGCGSRVPTVADDAGTDAAPDAADASLGEPCKTTVTGIVYDPAGKRPLYDVLVFVPSAPLDPLPAGVTCDRCGALISGKPLAAAITKPDGTFLLDGVPAGDSVPLVLQVGKWRRKVVVPHVASCANTAMTDPNTMRLPKTQSEGDMPQIAIATGGCDSEEELLVKMGIDPSEITQPDGKGRVHFYQAGYGAHYKDQPTAQASSLWTNLQTLMKYDAVILPCECSSEPDWEFEGQADPRFDKTPTAHQNLFDYANAGGRLFVSHYTLDAWIGGGPAPFPTTADWGSPMAPADGRFTIETSFPKGKAFSQWLANQGSLVGPNTLAIFSPRSDVTGVENGSRSWVSYPNTMGVELFTFNTPVGLDPAKQCGRVVASDFHVSGGSGNINAGPYDPMQTPSFDPSMVSGTLSPQEQALEFMLFDLTSCVQDDSIDPQPPR